MLSLKGSRTARPSRAKTWKPRKKSAFRSFAAASPRLPLFRKICTWWQPRYGANAVVHQAHLIVMATDDASVWRACVCHVSCRPRKQERTHNLKRMPIDWMLCGRVIQTHTYFLGNSKATAQPRYTLQHQRYTSRSATAPALQAPVIVTATVLLCVCVQRSPEDKCNRDHAFTSNFSITKHKKVEPHAVAIEIATPVVMIFPLFQPHLGGEPCMNIYTE